MHLLFEKGCYSEQTQLMPTLLILKGMGQRRRNRSEKKQIALLWLVEDRLLRVLLRQRKHRLTDIDKQYSSNSWL